MRRRHSCSTAACRVPVSAGSQRRVATSEIPRLESDVLARELRKLGDIGSGWISRLLPAVVYDCRLSLTGTNSAKVAAALRRFLEENARSAPELPSDPVARRYCAVIGSGLGVLNPTLVRIQVENIAAGCSVTPYAVAKEGAFSPQGGRAYRSLPRPDFSAQHLVLDVVARALYVHTLWI